MSDVCDVSDHAPSVCLSVSSAGAALGAVPPPAAVTSAGQVTSLSYSVPPPPPRPLQPLPPASYVTMTSREPLSAAAAAGAGAGAAGCGEYTYTTATATMMTPGAMTATVRHPSPLAPAPALQQVSVMSSMTSLYAMNGYGGYDVYPEQRYHAEAALMASAAYEPVQVRAV